MVIVLVVLFGDDLRLDRHAGDADQRRSAAVDSSVASACETKNVRITCSSYCVRFCVLSAATMMVRSFRTR